MMKFPHALRAGGSLVLTWAALLALACLALGACKKQRQHLTRANIAVVEKQFAQAQEQWRKGAREASVSVKEVESVLGPPNRIDPPETSLRDVEVYRYYYQQDADTYELHFFQSQLIQIARIAAGTAANFPTP